MPHVSSKRVKKKAFKKISAELANTIAGTNSKDIIRELLTPTERIMLAKRLAIILMLERGLPFSAIERTLKISPSTAVRFWKLIKLGSFTALTRQVTRSKNNKKFWAELENIILLGMPPRGRRRWNKIRHLVRKK